MSKRILLLAALCAVLPLHMFGGSISVFVGYADDLRASPFFPAPWFGSPGVIGIGMASGVDSGAIRIDNTGTTGISIGDISVTINGTAMGDIWSASLPVSLAPGQSLIVDQTVQYNFDTSDIHPIVACCTVVPPGTTPFPTVSITVDGTTTVFNDTGHVLDTGGFDFASIGNESFQWRPIGTVGGQAGTPEPSSMVLLASGLIGVGVSKRRWFRRR